MDQQRLDAIRARCEAATPGPWYNGDGSVDMFFAGKNTVATQERVIVERATYNDDFDQQTYADIDFIAASRTDVPEMCDEIARLTDENASIRSWATAVEGQLKRDGETIKEYLDENERLTILVEASEHFTLSVSKHLLGNGPGAAVRLIKQELDNFLELSGGAEKEAEDHGRGDAAGG